VGKRNCQDNRKLSEAKELNSKTAKAIAEALKIKTDDAEVTKRLSDALIVYQEANRDLDRMQTRHQRDCSVCQKGD
jgi:hypothetical protein